MAIIPLLLRKFLKAPQRMERFAKPRPVSEVMYTTFASVCYGLDGESDLALGAHHIRNIVAVRTSVRCRFGTDRGSVRGWSFRGGGESPVRRSLVPHHVGSSSDNRFFQMAPLSLVQEKEEQVGREIQINWYLEQKSGFAVDPYYNRFFVGDSAGG